MRVSSAQLGQYVLKGLDRQGTEYAKVMEQMSSGYRITKPSDDPLGTVTLLGLKSEQGSLDQYRTNIGNVSSRLEKAESYLDSSYQVMLRVQDLTLSGTNGAATDADRLAYAGELQSLRDTLLDFANAQDEEGHYLFGGSQVDKPPLVDNGSGTLVYQGDSLGRQVQVAKGVSMDANETVQNIYFAGGNNFFADLDGFIQQLQTPGASVSASGAAMLGRIDGAITGINRSLTDIGGRLSSLHSLDTAQQDLGLANDKVIGQIQDLDYAAAADKVNQIQLTLTATQKTYSQLSQLSLFDYL
ncbi:flagellar hook-associated protein FlgL [Gallaecimonas kandeliae]|uniref:flagellar hook-associated protein FlgL n=1 Tax=Gallaecimonas kandeliae TaxID=3029055 RepID=UPI002649A5CB|nr:flagellar hook-associated protein FlgL [Gallaecimonas kandeliae]WKE66538.1 flagellar hook-associated protein FlgL [Gallaecimonas kandeliae]